MSNSKVASRPIALVGSSLAGGGAERMWLNLAEELLMRGHKVDLVLLSMSGQLHSCVPEGVSVFGAVRSPGERALLRGLPERQQFHDLRVDRVRRIRSWIAHRRRWPANIRWLCSARIAHEAEIVRAYMATQNPQALLAAAIPANRATVMARQDEGHSDAKVAVTIRNNVQKGYTMRDQERAEFLYPQADWVIGVSSGVAAAAARQFSLPRERVHYVHNGIAIHRIKELCEASSRLRCGSFPFDEPAILCAARLTGRKGQKDHITLLRAFALVRKKLAAKLVLLGTGQQTGATCGELMALASELGVASDVVWWGFEDNPYPCIRAASVLVVSSRWEGLPGVLIEAMACGTPVVSTDAPFGPAEVLDGGRFGHLVPIGDEVRMATAIEEVLAGNHLPSDALKARAEEFSVGRMADGYERIIFCESRSESDDALLAIGGADAG